MSTSATSSRAVFVDWHGVLSNDIFWSSILTDTTHPLCSQLETSFASILEGAIGNAWMKGLLSCDQVIAAMGVQLGHRFPGDFLAQRLHVDCARMKVNVELFTALREIKTRAWVVLATNNMDCFARTFDQVRVHPKQPEPGSETLADWAVICDDIICSSNIGVLKAEDPVGFFGSWLTTHGLQFRDAVLIDDRANNCAAFADQGGTSIHYAMANNKVVDVVESLHEWFTSG